MTYRLPHAHGQSDTVQSPTPWSFKMRPDEAIVLIGQTPPPMAYFSYQTFLLLRDYEEEGPLKRIFATLGDTSNVLTVQTKGTKRDPFQQDVIFMSTGDNRIAEQVKRAARKAGIPTKSVNTETLPSSLLRMGVEHESDEFAFIHRMFLPEKGYEQALEDYLNATQVVFRVSPADPIPPTQPPDPFPTAKLRVRGTGTTEMDLAPAVKELRKAILQRYSGMSTTDYTTGVWLTDGFDGLQRSFPEAIDMLGPTRDAIYLRSTPYLNLSDSPDDFLIVYGANHEATQKATYGNFAIYGNSRPSTSQYYGQDLLVGIKGKHTGQLAGTAVDYLPYNPSPILSDNVNKLYAYKVSRKCKTDDTNCLEITCNIVQLPSDPEPKPCSELDLNGDLFVGWRIYLEKETKVGPAFTEILYDRVIKFSRSQ